MSKDANVEMNDTMLNLVDEINHLATLRRTLNLGTNTRQRNSAESLISRRITSRVNELSELILKNYKE